MRVISQDGTIDVPYELTSIQLVSKTTIVAQGSYFGSGNDNFATIAEYSTEEKAKKAMEMLRNNYLDFMTEATPDGNGFCFNQPKVFQFPKDEDVEVQPMPDVISLLESIQRDMDDNIYNFTKDGKCSSCGGCCSNLSLS